MFIFLNQRVRVVRVFVPGTVRVPYGYRMGTVRVPSKRPQKVNFRLNVDGCLGFMNLQINPISEIYFSRTCKPAVHFWHRHSSRAASALVFTLKS